MVGLKKSMSLELPAWPGSLWAGRIWVSHLEEGADWCCGQCRELAPGPAVTIWPVRGGGGQPQAPDCVCFMLLSEAEQVQPSPLALICSMCWEHPWQLRCSQEPSGRVWCLRQQCHRQRWVTACLERGWLLFVLANPAASGSGPREHERLGLEGPLCWGRDQWELEF